MVFHWISSHKLSCSAKLGMALPEAAQALGISSRTADRLWAYARPWLRVEIKSGQAR
jgi:ECF sigma factor